MDAGERPGQKVQVLCTELAVPSVLGFQCRKVDIEALTFSGASERQHLPDRN